MALCREAIERGQQRRRRLGLVGLGGKRPGGGHLQVVIGSRQPVVGNRQGLRPLQPDQFFEGGLTHVVVSVGAKADEPVDRRQVTGGAGGVHPHLPGRMIEESRQERPRLIGRDLRQADDRVGGPVPPRRTSRRT